MSVCACSQLNPKSRDIITNKEHPTTYMYRERERNCVCVGGGGGGA